MMECSICGVSDRLQPIFRALSPTGIVFVCEKCAQEQGYPIVRKPQAREAEEKRDTVYETMVRLSGVKPLEKPQRFANVGREERVKEIIRKNYERKTEQEAVVLVPRTDLVDNFNWVIMRVRRVKGLTQGQLAERIGESESVVKMAEQGVVPAGYVLMNKLENFLGVRLIKDKTITTETGFKTENPKPQIQQQPQQTFQQQKFQTQPILPIKTITEVKKDEQRVIYPKSSVLSFDSKILDTLTIDDLRRMRKERETKTEEDEPKEEKKYAGDYDD